MENNNIIDLALLALSVLGFLQGYRKGLFTSVMEFGGFALSSILTIQLTPFCSILVKKIFNPADQTMHGVMYAVVTVLTFIVTKRLLQYLAYLLTETLNKLRLGFVNKTLGGLFGIMRSVFLTIIIIGVADFLNTYLKLIPEGVLENSKLYTPMRDGLKSFVFALYNAFV